MPVFTTGGHWTDREFPYDRHMDAGCTDNAEIVEDESVVKSVFLGPRKICKCSNYES